MDAPALAASVRRASFLIVEGVVNEVDASVRNLHSDEEPSSHRIAPSSSSAPSSPPPSAAPIRLNLLETRSSIAALVFRQNFAAVFGAVIAALVLYPIFLLQLHLSSSLFIRRAFFAALFAAINVEVLSVVLYGLKSSLFMRRHLLVMWPCFLLSVVAVVLLRSWLDVNSAAAAACGGLCWTLSMASQGLYDIFARVPNKSSMKEVLKTVKSAFMKGLVATIMNVAPSFAVLFPVRFLASNYPLLNNLVSGVGFPALTFVLRKFLLSWLMRRMSSRVSDGEMSPSKLLPAYASTSKVLTTCLVQANIVALYMSTTMEGCVVSAMLSVLTEVGGKAYVVHSMRHGIRNHIMASAPKAVKRVIANIGAEAGERVTEEGVAKKRDDEEDWDFILGMLAVRWNQDIIAEKSAILLAAYLIYMFKLSVVSVLELIELAAILYSFEFLTDLLLVLMLDNYYYLPFRRLPPSESRDFVKEASAHTQALLTCAFGLNLVSDVVDETLGMLLVKF